MTQRMQNVLSGLLIVGYAASAQAISIGAYAVGTHTPCGISNIPGTIRELDKFFASKDLPADTVKNFYWKDTRVRQNQWVKEGDYKESTEASTGFDGADSSLLTYIASHGVTSKGVYKALAGSPKEGGCYISSPALSIGDQLSRYTILSTCQGLKIGTGDSPTSVGENPSKTWKDSAKGSNCILGYSNNMADEDSYGTYLLEKLKAGQTSLAESFMASSEAVSKANIPAVLCFGSSKEDAADYIKNNKTFEEASRGGDVSAWVYRKNATLGSGNLKDIASQISPAITVEPLKVSPSYFAKSIQGSATYDARTNVMQITKAIEASKNDEVPSMEEATEIAINALNASGLANAAGKLILTDHSEDVLGGEDGVQQVIQRKFSFKQALGGFKALGQAGSIEVAVGPGGAVSGVTASLLQVSGKEKGFANVNAAAEDLEAIAIKNVSQKVPGATYKVISTTYGYDAGNFFGMKSHADAVAEIVVEASQGGFARRHIEKIKL